jgi:hypothetical protein
MKSNTNQINKDCMEASKVLTDHYLRKKVTEKALNIARAHHDNCVLCSIGSIKALKEIAFGNPGEISCTECRKQLIKLISIGGKAWLEAPVVDIAAYHLANCPSCHQEYQILREQAIAGEKPEFNKYPEFDLSFLPKKREQESPIKISVRFLKDSTIKIIEATGQVFTGMELVTSTVKPVILAMRTSPALSSDAEKIKSKRPFVEVTVKVTDSNWAAIKLAQDSEKRNDIWIKTFTIDKNDKPRPTTGLLIAIKGPSKMPDLPVKTSIQGLASFKKLPGNYILSIYDNKVKLGEYELILESE